jgi:hypothetical protein
MATPPAPERLDELLRFLPLFDQPGRVFVDTSAAAATSSLPVYAPDVLEFFRLAGRGCWDDPDYVPSTAARMLLDDTLVQSATIDEIRTMLTFCVRGERFCDGHWEGVLRSGRIVALLKRLQTLRGEMRGAAGSE